MEGERVGSESSKGMGSREKFKTLTVLINTLEYYQKPEPNTVLQCYLTCI